MPDKTYISQIKLPSGTTYDIKDAQAREKIAQLAGLDTVKFMGVSSTALTDGGNENPKVDGTVVTEKKTGDLYFYGTSEFIYGADSKWHALGDLTTLGALAYKDDASADYTPAGTVSQPTFSDGAVKASGSYTPAGTITLTTSEATVVSGVSKSTGTVYGKTEDGSVTAGEAASLDPGFVTAGTAASASFKEGAFVANVPTVIDTEKFNAGSLPSKAADTFDAGALPTKAADTFTQGTQAALTTTVSNEVLEIGFTANTLPTFTEGAFTQGSLPSFTEGSFSAGSLPSLEAGFYTAGSAASKAADSFSFTANTPTVVDTTKFDGGTPTVVTLPTFEESTFVTDVSATSGTQDIPTGATFAGTAATIEVEGTATGTVSQPTFNGTQATITVS